MTNSQPNNPLHGITLKAMLEELVERRGWENLAEHVSIRCFSSDPSVSSSLKFLRKTGWARRKVEELYLADLRARDRPNPWGRGSSSSPDRDSE